LQRHIAHLGDDVIEDVNQSLEISLGLIDL